MKKLLLILKSKRKKTKISFNTYLKSIENIEIGEKCQINSNCSLDASRNGKIILKNNVVLNRYVYLNAFKGNIFIDEGSEINNYSIINGTGGVTIGKNVLIGPNVQIISYQHNYNIKFENIKFQGLKKDKIIIGDDVWIGAGSVILAGIKIAKGCVIGAGSVVTKDTKEYGVYVGVPAKFLKYRGENDK